MPYILPPNMTIDQVACQIAKLCKPDMIHRIVIEEAENAIKQYNVARVQECADLGYVPDQNAWIFDSVFSNMTYPFEARAALLTTVVKNWGNLLLPERIGPSLVCSNVTELTAVAREAGLEISPDVENCMVIRALNYTGGSLLDRAKLVLKMMDAGFTIKDDVVNRAISNYFSSCHRKWNISAAMRRGYVEFINKLIENDSVVLGPGAIPSLKRLSKLSLLSLKAKAKIHAAALAAELVGNAVQEE